MRRALTCLAVLLLAVACSDVPKPDGAAPLRYRDPVFTNVTVVRDLQYGQAPDDAGTPVALKLDLYQPEGDTVTARPAAIFVHGGGYSGGDKSSGPSQELAHYFASLGYVTMSINYRLIKNGCSAGDGNVSSDCNAAAINAIHDAQAAVRWLRANAATYRVDTDRIAIGGESAGAITATGVGIWSDQPGDSGNPGYSSKVRAWQSVSGGVPGGIFVDSSDSPGYLFSGTADPIVPYQWSVETAAGMQKAGVFVVLKSLPGAGHVPWVQYHDVFVNQTDWFFYDMLDLAHAAQ